MDRELYKNLYYGKKRFHLNKLFISEYGLYDLVIRSKKPSAKKFTYWVTKIVLPSIRKYGYYVLLEEHKETYAQMLEKINYLEEENEKLKKDFVKQKYPNGGYVYVIDYSNKYDDIYRIGETLSLTKRKKSYDTHMPHKKDYVYYVKHNNPYQLELCIRSMLYKYKFSGDKDIKNMEKQSGGSKSQYKNNKINNPIEKILCDSKKKLYCVKNDIKNLHKIIDS